jgi:hypothetical protein
VQSYSGCIDVAEGTYSEYSITEIYAITVGVHGLPTRRVHLGSACGVRTLQLLHFDSKTKLIL